MKKMNLTKLTGLALTVIGFIPTVLWAANLIQGKSAADILWGAPVVCIGAYLLNKDDDDGEVPFDFDF